MVVDLQDEIFDVRVSADFEADALWKLQGWCVHRPRVDDGLPGLTDWCSVKVL